MTLYSSILRPLLFRLPPETAHEMALYFCRTGLGPRFMRQMFARSFVRRPFGELQRFGLSFSNPVGLAAGFDKNGVAARSLSALGFGFIEVGTVTNLPQPGNPRPRLFRLSEDCALLNRLGFNNHGAQQVAQTLAGSRPGCVLGVNLGKSRAVPVEEAASDYLSSFEAVYDVADYVAINVSSPNTPGLRELQRADALSRLLSLLQERNHELQHARGRKRPLPLLVKIAPDLSRRELEEIVDVALGSRIAGIIATNTTTERTSLRTPSRIVEAYGAGGLSGAPLRTRSTEIIAMLYRLTGGRVPLVGVGGIFNAEDAWEKICAGASLVQLYTGFVYKGFGVVRDINEGLAEILSKHGISSLDEAVGSRAEEIAAA